MKTNDYARGVGRPRRRGVLRTERVRVVRRVDSRDRDVEILERVEVLTEDSKFSKEIPAQALSLERQDLRYLVASVDERVLARGRDSENLFPAAQRLRVTTKSCLLYTSDAADEAYDV